MAETKGQEIKKTKYALIGLSAALSLLMFYFIVASLFGGLSFAIGNFVKLWYWMIPLVAGFGIQMGGFFYFKQIMRASVAGNAIASTGISTTSMVACCVHHIADIAPFLGITTLGLFLGKYQPAFLILGIVSNALGIVYMFGMLSTKTSKNIMKKIFYLLLALSVLMVIASFIYISKNDENSGDKSVLSRTLVDIQNDVEFKVTQLSTSEYRIIIDTHSVELDFDLVEISALYDGLGNMYKPLTWEGFPTGGHHREGTLKFQPINTGSIKLVITDSARREFIWDLK